jgi:hypothetical protein
MGKMYSYDRDLAVDYKLFVGDPVGLLGPPERTEHLVQIPGRRGRLRVRGEGDTPERHFSVASVIRGATTTETADLWSDLIRLLSNDELELWFDALGSDRRVYAYYEGIETAEQQGLKAGFQFNMKFAMPDPVKFAKETDSYAIKNGQVVPIALGSAQSDVHVQVIGLGLANPRVLYRDAQGLVAGDVSFGLTLLGGDWIDWNKDGYQMAELYTDSGTRIADVPEMILTLPFVGDPNDGDASQGPTLAAVNCDMLAYVRRAWL